MTDLASTLLIFGGAFALSILLAWLVTRSGGLSRGALMPLEGAPVRIRAVSGVYRSRLGSVGSATWRLDAPVHFNAYVPLRAGEELTLEIPSPNGVLLCRTEILSREETPHAFVVRCPSRIHRVERRQSHRWLGWEGQTAVVEGQLVCLLDLSEGGARFRSRADFRSGDRVRLRLGDAIDACAWVLGTENFVTRIRFEEAISPRQPVS